MFMNASDFLVRGFFPARLDSKLAKKWRAWKKIRNEDGVREQIFWSFSVGRLHGKSRCRMC